MHCDEGEYNGLLAIRDNEGAEVWSHQLGAAVWAVSWRSSRREVAPSSSNKTDVQDSILVACTFEPRVWLLDTGAHLVLRSTSLTCDPLSVAFVPGGESWAQKHILPVECFAAWSPGLCSPGNPVCRLLIARGNGTSLSLIAVTRRSLHSTLIDQTFDAVEAAAVTIHSDSPTTLEATVGNAGYQDSGSAGEAQACGNCIAQAIRSTAQTAADGATCDRSGFGSKRFCSVPELADVLAAFTTELLLTQQAELICSSDCKNGP